MSRSTTGLAGLFATLGVLHFARPEPFEAIVPKALPRTKDLVYLSGAAELACAAGLLHPRTRRVSTSATCSGRSSGTVPSPLPRPT